MFLTTQMKNVVFFKITPEVWLLIYSVEDKDCKDDEFRQSWNNKPVY